MKQRVLRRFGTPDGVDIQYIEGKQCWSCDGSGVWYHTYSGDEDCCWRCGGSGWFKHPVWVTLQRWRLGRYVFHEPIQRRYEEPTEKPVAITGYVEHRYYTHRQVRRATILLGLMFDWRVARPQIVEWWEWSRLVRVVGSRCHGCNRHTFSIKRSYCKSCTAAIEREKLSVTDDAPF